MMSAYPPTPPLAPPPSSFRPDAKAQARAAREQAKLQRLRLRMERQALRRRSIVGPLILIAIGIVLLEVQRGKISWAELLAAYGRWWPALLIAAGVILLLEWGIDRWRQNAGGAAPVRVLGGGVVLLLILLTLAGFSSHVVESGLYWKDRALGQGFGNLDYLFGDRHDGYSSTSAALPEGGTLAINDPHGNVTVTGGSTDGQVHVMVHTQAHAWNAPRAQRAMQQLQPEISRRGTTLLLAVAAVAGGAADLTVTAPSTASVMVNAGHGDVTIGMLQAPVSLSANHGNVEISDIGAAVKANVHDDNANLTVHGISGPVSIAGHSGDVDIADVSGAVQLQGDFYGTTDVKHVTGTIHFQTSRTRFSAARLEGEFSVQRESLDASGLVGPVMLRTANKNITLDRAEGDVDVSDSNGSVELTNTPPVGAVEVQNRHGSVEVSMPPGAGFVLNAQTRNGDIANDFGLTPQNDHEIHALRGTIAGGGPAVTIATSDGDVIVRRSTVAAPPPARPAPPKIGAAPTLRRCPGLRRLLRANSQNW